ncbi:MAG TPA: hypothetical protein VGK20_00735 [Candidatus Binatia bacterium]|jgi:hypothetical protein
MRSAAVVVVAAFVLVAGVGPAAAQSKPLEMDCTSGAYLEQGSIEVKLDGGTLHFIQHAPASDFLDPKVDHARAPSEKEWKDLRRTLDAVDFWNWKTNYEIPDAVAGRYWSVTVRYADRSASVHGRNAWPGDEDPATVSKTPTKRYERLRATIQALVGSGYPFQ